MKGKIFKVLIGAAIIAGGAYAALVGFGKGLALLPTPTPAITQTPDQGDIILSGAELWKYTNSTLSPIVGNSTTLNNLTITGVCTGCSVAGGSSAPLGIEITTINGAFGTHFGSISFDANSFSLAGGSPTASASAIRLNWGASGVASRSATNTWTALNTFNKSGLALQITGNASVSANFEVSGNASVSKIFGAGLGTCTGNNFWQSTTAGLFNCTAPSASGGSTFKGVSVNNDINSSTFTHVGSFSFDKNQFNESTTASQSLVRLNWSGTSGVPSKSAQNTWASLQTFSLGASLSTNLEVGGYASIGNPNASNSFKGSLNISKGLRANSFQGGGLANCSSGQAVNYSAGQFTCTNLNLIFQPLSPHLTAFNGIDLTTGFVSQVVADPVGATDFQKRTLTVEANQLVLTNGDGVSGNPLFKINWGASGVASRSAQNDWTALNTFTNASVSGNVELTGAGSKLIIGAVKQGDISSGLEVVGVASISGSFWTFGTASVASNFEIGNNLYRFLSGGASLSAPVGVTGTNGSASFSLWGNTNLINSKFIFSTGSESLNGYNGAGALIFKVASSGDIAFGNGIPNANNLTSVLNVYGSDASLYFQQSNGAANGPGFSFAKSRGTATAPTATLANDRLAVFNGGGYDGSNWVQNKVAIRFAAAGNWKTTSTPTELRFSTTASGSTTLVEGAMLDMNGKWIMEAGGSSSANFEISGIASISRKLNIGGLAIPVDSIAQLASTATILTLKSTSQSTSSVAIDFLPNNGAAQSKFTLKAGGASTLASESLSVINANGTLWSISSSGYEQLQTTSGGRCQGLRFSNGATGVGSFQALDLGGQSYIFFSNSRCYDGNAWKALPGAAARGSGDFQIIDNVFAWITFPANSNTGTEWMRLTSNGHLGLGTLSPGFDVTIASTGAGVLLSLKGSAGTCNHTPGAASETVSCSSDRKLKTNITDLNLTGALNTIMKYHLRDYTIKSTGQEAIGVIAQELQGTLPDQVKVDPNGTLMVNQPSPWLLLAGEQELNLRVTALEKGKVFGSVASVTSLESQINALSFWQILKILILKLGLQ